MAYIKYNGIDSRAIKCAGDPTTSKECGISFDDWNGKPILRFHHLAPMAGMGGLHEHTDAMTLSKENIDALISELKVVREQYWQEVKRLSVLECEHSHVNIARPSDKFRYRLEFTSKDPSDIDRISKEIDGFPAQYSRRPAENCAEPVADYEVRYEFSPWLPKPRKLLKNLNLSEMAKLSMRITKLKP